MFDLVRNLYVIEIWQKLKIKLSFFKCLKKNIEEKLK